jgi:hypothetical protein
MPCFVPENSQHLRWHVIMPEKLPGPGGVRHHPMFEIAEWVRDERNGPTEKGHWVRWGYCGDFPSLCRATYIMPFPGQDTLTKVLAVAEGSDAVSAA